MHQLEGIVFGRLDCEETFASKARGYLVFPLKNLLGHHCVNAEIARGMASFDPHILMSLPV